MCLSFKRVHVELFEHEIVKKDGKQLLSSSLLLLTIMIIHLHVIKVITYPTAKTISDSFFVNQPLKDSNVILL